MKTKIITLITLLAVVLSTTNFTYAAKKTSETSTVLNNIGNFSKIEARGNVEVYVMNGAKNEVKVYNNYYAESALVQDQKGTLRISSYKNEKLVVYVTVTDLSSITAYDNATIRSFGKLSLINLDVTLYNNAYASLNLDNYAADITVNDQARADLKGSVEEYSFKYSLSSSVNYTDLVAAHATENKLNLATATRLETETMVSL